MDSKVTKPPLRTDNERLNVYFTRQQRTFICHRLFQNKLITCIKFSDRCLTGARQKKRPHWDDEKVATAA